MCVQFRVQACFCFIISINCFIKFWVSSLLFNSLSSLTLASSNCKSVFILYSWNISFCSRCSFFNWWVSFSISVFLWSRASSKEASLKFNLANQSRFSSFGWMLDGMRLLASKQRGVFTHCHTAIFDLRHHWHASFSLE